MQHRLNRRQFITLLGGAAAWPLVARAQQQAIVFPVAVDPVGAGIVDSLARPGGNATGFGGFEYSLGGKWLELLKQITPGMTYGACCIGRWYLGDPSFVHPLAGG